MSDCETNLSEILLHFTFAMFVVGILIVLVGAFIRATGTYSRTLAAAQYA